MTAPHADQIISGYLARLEEALADLPPARRTELLDDVRTHIAEARSTLAAETDADLLNILDKLGDPSEIAAEARGGRTAPAICATAPATPVALFEIAAIVLLVLVWPVGAALVWLSTAWSRRDKLLATVAFPGVFLFLSFLPAPGFFAHWHLLFVVVLFTPVVWSLSAIYLAIRLYLSRQGDSTRPDANRPRRPGALEVAAIVLTPLLWPVGVILLWTSPFWNTRDKLISSLVPPGGYLGVGVIVSMALFVAAPGGSCGSSADTFGNVTTTCAYYGPPRWVSGVAIAITLMLLVLPLLTAAYLGFRLRQTEVRPAVPA